MEDCVKIVTICGECRAHACYMCMVDSSRVYVCMYVCVYAYAYACVYGGENFGCIVSMCFVWCVMFVGELVRWYCM